MSKLRYIILLSLSVLCLVPIQAQRRYSASNRGEYGLAGKSGFSTKDVEGKTDVLFGLHSSEYGGVHHMIGFSVEGAWSSLVSNMPAALVTPGGGSAGLHLLYEFQFNGLLVQTGVGVAFQRVYNNIADTAIYHPNILYSWNGSAPILCTVKHQFAERQDMSQQAYGQVPLYVGHYFFGARGIGYFLGGIHANYAFWGTTQQRLTGSTYGKYEKYIGIWQQMDNHGFRQDVPIERTGKQLQLKLDVMAHVELGYEYNTRQSSKSYRRRPSDRLDGRIRVAGFVDFGILNICPNTNGVFYEMPEETLFDFPTYQMDHVFATQDASKFWVRNLFAGIRVSFLFGFQPPERCILCDTWKH